jgi:hypothetical protein
MDVRTDHSNVPVLVVNTYARRDADATMALETRPVPTCGRSF